MIKATENAVVCIGGDEYKIKKGSSVDGLPADVVRLLERDGLAAEAKKEAMKND